MCRPPVMSYVLCTVPACLGPVTVYHCMLLSWALLLHALPYVITPISTVYVIALCHDMKCYLRYLTRDRIQTQNVDTLT